MGLMKVVDNFVLCGGFNGEELNKISCGVVMMPHG